MIGNELVKYNELKSDEKIVKSQLNASKEKIVNYMTEFEVNEVTYGDLVATYKGSERSTMNEEKLIECVEKFARQTKDAETRKSIRSCIKKVKAIDESALETLIYNEIIPPEAIHSAYESKTVYTLRVAKKKPVKE